MLIDSFWKFVDVKSENECWVWKGNRFSTGYGRCSFGRAHRVAWELIHGVIPEGMFVLHSCDNKPCCNPKHLFLGTRKDNAQDAKRKGIAYTNEHMSKARAASVIVCRNRNYPKLSDEQKRKISSTMMGNKNASGNKSRPKSV